MRVDFYTLDVRECRAKRGARRERTNITKTGKMQSIFPEREAQMGSLKNAKRFLGGAERQKKKTAQITVFQNTKYFYI